VGFFQDRVLKNYLPGLALNRDPPISASWEARITGMKHTCAWLSYL
jgi:hypothetical protein